MAASTRMIGDGAMAGTPPAGGRRRRMLGLLLSLALCLTYAAQPASAADGCPEGCTRPKLCVDGACRCPILYRGSDDCTKPTPARNSTFGGWCAMALNSKRFWEYARDRHRAQLKKGNKTFWNPERERLSGSLFLDGERKLNQVGHRRFDTCAVVGASNVLRRRNYADRIDNHTTVIRFNAAPTRGSFGRIVGRKTTIRIQNIQYCGYSTSRRERW